MRFFFIDESYGRGGGLGRTRGIGVGLAEDVGVGLGGRVAVGVGVGPPCAQYLPPVFNWVGLSPPQTIISLPVHTAV